MNRPNPARESSRMLKVSAKIEIEFIPTAQFTRWAGMLLLVLHWLGFL